ncbi:MAG: hypothetical protein F6K41_10330 [Symploca sp. SIO3E6]|nr:hypothetical protein [Caldora sp. SIO3E6]
MRKILTALATTSLLLGVIQPVQADPCRAYVVNAPNAPNGYREVNNCPIINGTFVNSDWNVEIGRYEPLTYYYRGTSRSDGSSIEIVDGNVKGTTNRPQYFFYNGDFAYVVTFQNSDPNTIRLEIYQGQRRILNQLLYR